MPPSPSRGASRNSCTLQPEGLEPALPWEAGSQGSGVLQRALPARVCTAPSLPVPAWPCRPCPRRHPGSPPAHGKQISPRLGSVRCWGHCQVRLELCHPRARRAGAPACASCLPRAPRVHAAAVSLPQPQHRLRGARRPAPTCSRSIFNSLLGRPCPAHPGARAHGELGRKGNHGGLAPDVPVTLSRSPLLPRLQGEGHPEQDGRRAQRCWQGAQQHPSWEHPCSGSIPAPGQLQEPWDEVSRDRALAAELSGSLGKAANLPGLPPAPCKQPGKAWPLPCPLIPASRCSSQARPRSHGTVPAPAVVAGGGSWRGSGCPFWGGQR